MKWLEIIEIQSVGNNQDLIELNLKNLLDEIKSDKTGKLIKIYNNVSVMTDYSIHIYNRTNKVNRQGSELGTRLVSTLKAFGLVNYTIWIDRFSDKVE
jgi:hypothetical protein